MIGKIDINRKGCLVLGKTVWYDISVKYEVSVSSNLLAKLMNN